MTVKNYAVQNRINEFSDLMKNFICATRNGERENTDESLTHLAKLIRQNNQEGGAIYIVGNGGSAAVASHAQTDFVNACHLRAFTLHESSLITCMANDFGYEVSYKLILKTVFKKNDILIAISSSGRSPNIHQAVDTAEQAGGLVVTFSGFNADNKLKKMGYLNFWLDSHDYGLVEIGHLFILHNLADRMAVGVNKGQKIEYAVS